MDFNLMNEGIHTHVNGHGFASKRHFIEFLLYGY